MISTCHVYCLRVTVDKSSKYKKKGKTLGRRLISTFLSFARAGPDFTMETGMKGKQLPSKRKIITAM